MYSIWQHIPLTLDPIAFTFWSVTIYWYALFLLGGSACTYSAFKKYALHKKIFTSEQADDFSFGVFVASLVGAKLGFILVYCLPFISLYSVSNTMNFDGNFSLPGMSFIGGCIGVNLYTLYFSFVHKRSFFSLTDILAPFIPIGIFFGRLGNFFHVELPGRVTTLPWGMFFPGESFLRHPSTLYGAFLEGVVLFSILFFLRKKNVCTAEGVMTAYFAIFYGLLRFLSECFREPDAQIGFIGMLTINQIFALIFLCIGGLLLLFKKNKK